MRLRYVKEPCGGKFADQPCDLREYLANPVILRDYDYTVWPLEPISTLTWSVWFAERISGRGFRKRIRLCKTHRRLMAENYEDIGRQEVQLTERTDNYYNRQGHMLRP